MKILAHIAMLAVSGVLVAGSAQAADVTQDGSRAVVSYGDLDVSHADGAQILLRRLQAAASSVCGGAPYNGDLARQAFYRSCTQQAMDGAEARLDQNTRSALNDQAPEHLASAR